MTRRLWTLLLIVLLTQVGSAAPTPPDIITDHLVGPAVLLHGDPANMQAFNIVIVGDGFTNDAESMQAYRDAAQSVSDELLKTAPFAVFSGAISIHRVDLASDEAGIDVPLACGSLLYDPVVPFDWARSEKHPNNILETSWCAPSVTAGSPRKEFLDSINHPRIDAAALTAGVIPNVTIVLVNDWMFGATAWPGQLGQLVFASIGKNLTGDRNPDFGPTDPAGVLKPNLPAAFPGVVVHELGHLAPFLLLDEYTGGATLTPAKKPTIDLSPNLATGDKLTPVKWSTLVTAPVPTERVPDCATPPIPFNGSPLAVGAFERGYGINCGVYHPQPNCRMNRTDATFQTPFCLVCRRQLGTRLAFYLPLLNIKVPRQMNAPTRRDIAAATRRYWLILERLTLKSGPAAAYSLKYALSYGSEHASGVWPQTSGVQLRKGDVVDIGQLTTQVQWTSTESPQGQAQMATAVFQLSPTGGSGTAAGGDVLRFTPSSIAGAKMFVIDRPRYRLVVTVVAQR